MKTKGNIIWHFVIILTIILTISPIIFAVFSSFQSMNTLYGKHSVLSQISSFTIENYKRIFEKLPIIKIILNTFIIAISVTLFKTFTSVLAAYGFVFFDFKGKNIVYFLLISTIFIPFTVVMIPNYLTIANFNLTNTLLGVILPQLSDATGIFLNRQAMKSIPKSLIEIAQLDNIGRIRILKDIVLTITRPTIISTSIIFFINSWNEYVWPVLILKDKENFTLSLAMQMFVNAEGGTELPVVMSMAVVTMSVPIIFYLFFQKYIMSTFASSGIKG